MTRAQWETLRLKEWDRFVEEYFRFLYDEKNIGRCEECPMNVDNPDQNYGHRCGQQNCWVRIHCEEQS